MMRILAVDSRWQTLYGGGPTVYTVIASRQMNITASGCLQKALFSSIGTLCTCLVCRHNIDM